MDDDTIELMPIHPDDADRAELFALYRLSLREYIEQTFGWNEAFQRERFGRSYQEPDFRWIHVGKARAGYLALKAGEPAWHVSLLLLYPAYRRRGIGRAAMRILMARAAEAGRPLTLSCFRCNRPAMDFYRSLAFGVESEDEHFVVLRAPMS